MVGLVLGALYLAVTKAIGLLKSGINLLLDGKRQLDGDGRHGFDEQFTDCRVNFCTKDALAGWITIEPTTTGANVIGYVLSPAADVVVDMHSATA
jgi:hypothetical protein